MNKKKMHPVVTIFTVLAVLLPILFAIGTGPAPLPVFATFPGTNGKIAFDTNRDGNFEIYVMNADGTGQTRLTNNTASDALPSWSPDGTKIAFESDRNGNFQIYVMNANGTGQTRLTNNTAIDAVPSWSPDGTKIAFQSNRDGNVEIYVMNADGTGQTRLTNTTAFNGHPNWSPDGTKIAFDTNRDGNDEIYVMNANGTGQTRLTNNTAINESPSWSPDGTKIAFDTNRDNNFEIYLMNADGTGQTRLTNNAASDDAPSWSPDGTKIAFDTNRDGNVEIYVMNADGTGQTRLTNNAAIDEFPDWQRISQGGGPLPTTTSLSSSQNPSTSGQPVRFTATISPTPDGGTVQFKIDGANFGLPVNVVLGTSISSNISNLTAGTHTVKAIYSGTSKFTASFDTLTQSVNASPPCSPPVSGDWTITSSCVLSGSGTVNIAGNVIVQSGAVLTVPSGLTLHIDLLHHHLLVKSGGAVLIKIGGKIN